MSASTDTEQQAHEEVNQLQLHLTQTIQTEDKIETVEDKDNEGPPLDISPRRAREYSGWPLVQMAFVAVGVCYADLGTSPLYVLNAIIPPHASAPSKQDTIGIISVIFWLFTLVIIVKYAGFILAFGTPAGDGGSFALYQGLYPRPAHDDWDGDETGSISRTLSFYPALSMAGGKGPASPSKAADRRERILANKWLKILLGTWALWGSGLTMADGIITPAISVVSAAEGVALVKPDAPIVAISLAILVALALVQPLGPHRLSFLFAPLVTIWLLFLLISGAVNISSFPGIFRALDPSRAVMYFVRTGDYDAMAGALLAVTGCEALFANLGQMSRRSITLPLVVLVYPSLMIAYLGQGSKLVSHPECVSNIFYLSIPGGAGSSTYYLGLVLGVIATVIASQAMFTAVFSIVSQLVHMQCLPSIKQSFPNKKNPGQVFQHATNLLLAAAIVGAVAGFRASSKLTAAYGFAVATVMVATTVLVSLQIYFVKRRPWFLALLFFVVFGFLDGLTWGASVQKVPEGAWFSLSVGTALAIFMIWWSWCSEVVSEFDKANRRPLSSMIEYGKSEDGAGTPNRTSLRLRTVQGSEVPLHRMEQTMAVFWKPAGGCGVPHAFFSFVSKLPAIPTITIFMSLRVIAVAHVASSEQILVERHRSRAGFYGATLRLGYKDKLDLRAAEAELLNSIIGLERSAADIRRSQDCENVLTPSALVKALKSDDLICTHIWPNYYLTTSMPSSTLIAMKKMDSLATVLKVLGDALLHLIRRFLLCTLFRRMRGMFAEEEGPFDSSEEVIRVSICAEV